MLDLYSTTQVVNMLRATALGNVVVYRVRFFFTQIGLYSWEHIVIPFSRPMKSVFTDTRDAIGRDFSIFTDP